jgi:hypothetical protein
MTFRFDEKVVRLEVSMNDLSSVKVLYTKDNLRHVFLSPVLWQGTEHLDQGCAVASVQILQ